MCEHYVSSSIRLYSTVSLLDGRSIRPSTLSIASEPVDSDQQAQTEKAYRRV